MDFKMHAQDSSDILEGCKIRIRLLAFKNNSKKDRKVALKRFLIAWMIKVFKRLLFKVREDYICDYVREK